MDDELEPFVGRYDWDRAFAQNPDLPVFEVSQEERDRVYGVHITRQRMPRRPAATGSFSAV